MRGSFRPVTKVNIDMLEKGLLKLGSTSKKPDIAIVVQGADPFEHDELLSANHLSLSIEQMRKRDQLVHKFLKDRGIAQCYVISGGYGKRAHEPYIEFFKYLLR